MLCHCSVDYSDICTRVIICLSISLLLPAFQPKHQHFPRLAFSQTPSSRLINPVFLFCVTARRLPKHHKTDLAPSVPIVMRGRWGETKWRERCNKTETDGGKVENRCSDKSSGSVSIAQRLSWRKLLAFIFGEHVESKEVESVLLLLLQCIYFYSSKESFFTFATSCNTDEKKTNQEKKERRISRVPHSGLANVTINKKRWSDAALHLQ